MSFNTVSTEPSDAEIGLLMLAAGRQWRQTAQRSLVRRRMTNGAIALAALLLAWDLRLLTQLFT